MHFLLYITEKCNLECGYCEDKDHRKKFTQNISYELKDLINFFRKIDKLTLHFYGGEPLLYPEVIKYILDKAPINKATLQTNGIFLDRLEKKYLDKLDNISISIDGGREVTDSHRGSGVYNRIVEQLRHIKKNKYRGVINARMTITPCVNFLGSIKHLIEKFPYRFDNIYWQLNALFHKIQWFKMEYNPQITTLIKYWVKEMNDNNRVIQLVPFTGIIHSLLTNTRVNNVRCGASWCMWAIDTNGEIYPCPVMRNYKEYSLGNILDVDPVNLKPRIFLDGCPKCDVFSLCGGRCLCANKKNEWDKEGYNLVCGSVKHLIRELIKVLPIVRELITKNKISLNDFDTYHYFEVIP